MKVFLCGIAGTGMSALAGLFKQKGCEVLGSDSNFYSPVDKILEKMQVKIFPSYNKKNIPEDVNFCVIGNVISRGNPELEYILNKSIEYYSMAEALYRFFIKGKKSVVVAGTHGKTTISSFIAYLLDCAGLKPGFFIGGKPDNFDSNYSIGQGEYFVVEGDEYETSFFDRSSKFLKYYPSFLLLPALEYDHIDFFESENLYLKSFKNLVNQVPANGFIIVNRNYNMNIKAVEKSFAPVIFYGRNNSDYVLKDIIFENGYYNFTIRKNSQEIKFRTPLYGKYNVWNLSAGIIFGLKIGIPENIIKRAVETFKGVERRLCLINKLGNTLFFEDFAHHPTSIKNVLSSLKEMYPEKKIICFFEPRSWSLRRNFFQNRLIDSFFDSDELIIKEVFQGEKIHENQRLNVFKIKEELEKMGKRVLVFNECKGIKDFVSKIDYEEQNLVVIISNGNFGGLPAFVKQLKP